MKCPNCGTWNRASFAKCSRCGTALTAAQENHAAPKAQTPGETGRKTYIQIIEEGRATAAVDSRDQLAREMEDLADRKKRGEREQRRLRENSVAKGFAPSPYTADSMTGRKAFPTPQHTSYEREDAEAEGQVRPDAIHVPPRRVIGYDEDLRPDPGLGSGDEMNGRRRSRRIKVYRRGFLRRYGGFAALVLVIAALGMVGYETVYKPYAEKKNAQAGNKKVETTTSMMGEEPAHIIKIPGEDGQILWITELKQSYEVIDGYATIEVPDWKWYEDSPNITEETVAATLTPYLRTAAGEQKRMEKVTFEVEVPESPLELVSPPSNYITTYRQLYEIQFKVDKDSAVTITKHTAAGDETEDISDLVNNIEDSITYQAAIDPVGDNVFTITARAQYCREKTEKITIYRKPQQIRLDLAADIATRYSPNKVQDETTKEWYEPRMKISGTTLTWATIEVLTPYMNLDTTQMASDGVFSFEAVFDHIGINKITIKASAPGYEASIVEHEVYYVPIADIYTRKAWSMKDQYTDYLNNSEKRVANTQIYQCDGTITRIISENPQIAVMELNDGTNRPILLTNNTYDTWKKDSVYRVFGDAYGIYDGAPWLNARYSYLQTPKE